MIHIYNSCRNVSPNLKSFGRCQRYRRIGLGRPLECRSNDDGRAPPESKKPEKDESGSKKGEKGLKKEYPEEPTTCCMSGCANCVWLEYAEKLSEYYRDGGEQAIKEINEKVADPNVRAFLLHELRMRNIK